MSFKIHEQNGKRYSGPYHIVSAYQASSMTLYYDPAMKADIKILQLNKKKIKEQSILRNRYIIKTFFWYDSIYRAKVFLSSIPKLGHCFEVKVTDFDFSYHMSKILLISEFSETPNPAYFYAYFCFCTRKISFRGFSFTLYCHRTSKLNFKDVPRTSEISFVRRN